MSLNESIVEDAALEWFGELGYAVGHGPHLAPGEYAEGTLTPALSQRERESYGEVVQFRFAQTLTRPLPSAISAALRFPGGEEKEREAIRRLNPSIPEEARAVVKRYLNTRFERRPSP
jgi:type I restriction enzyme, R subunit